MSSNLVLILSGIAALGALSTFAVSLFLHRSSQAQLRFVQDQLGVAKDARKSQNMLQALEMLRDQDFRAALLVVRNRMKGRPHHTWDAGDVFHVLLVCSTYNMVGLMIKQDLLPRELFVQHWGGSVIDSYESLAQFIENRQQHNPLYCADYQWLYVQCRAARYSESASKEMPFPSQDSASGPQRRRTRALRRG